MYWSNGHRNITSQLQPGTVTMRSHNSHPPNSQFGVTRLWINVMLCMHNYYVSNEFYIVAHISHYFCVRACFFVRTSPSPPLPSYCMCRLPLGDVLDVRVFLFTVASLVRMTAVMQTEMCQLYVVNVRLCLAHIGSLNKVHCTHSFVHTYTL